MASSPLTVFRAHCHRVFFFHRTCLSSILWSSQVTTLARCTLATLLSLSVFSNRDLGSIGTAPEPLGVVFCPPSSFIVYLNCFPFTMEARFWPSGVSSVFLPKTKRFTHRLFFGSLPSELLHRGQFFIYRITRRCPHWVPSSTSCFSKWTFSF